MQVVGPSVRAFGVCVDATSTVVCEPLSSAMDMLLIPHLADSFAALASLYDAMPQLVTQELEALVLCDLLQCCLAMARLSGCDVPVSESDMLLQLAGDRWSCDSQCIHCFVMCLHQAFASLLFTIHFCPLAPLGPKYARYQL